MYGIAARSDLKVKIKRGPDHVLHPQGVALRLWQPFFEIQQVGPGQKPADLRPGARPVAQVEALGPAKPEDVNILVVQFQVFPKRIVFRGGGVCDGFRHAKIEAGFGQKQFFRFFPAQPALPGRGRVFRLMAKKDVQVVGRRFDALRTGISSKQEIQAAKQHPNCAQMIHIPAKIYFAGRITRCLLSLKVLILIGIPQ